MPWSGAESDWGEPCDRGHASESGPGGRGGAANLGGLGPIGDGGPVAEQPQGLNQPQGLIQPRPQMGAGRAARAIPRLPDRRNNHRGCKNPRADSFWGEGCFGAVKCVGFVQRRRDMVVKAAADKGPSALERRGKRLGRAV